MNTRAESGTSFTSDVPVEELDPFYKRLGQQLGAPAPPFLPDVSDRVQQDRSE